MGVVCVVVLERIDSQVVRLTALSNQVNQAREMIYEVTAQSHYRAMALLTDPTDPYWTDKIYAAKAEFDTNLSEIRTYAIGSPPETFDRIASDNEVYRTDSDGVTKLFDAGLIQRAIHAHIAKEHTQSHVLEAELNDLIAASQAVFLAETDSFARNRRLLTGVVAAISGLSLLAALALGAILSWSLIRPVRKVDSALARIAGGDFAVRVSVPNRDEFGSLADQPQPHGRSPVRRLPRPRDAQHQPPGDGRYQGRRARTDVAAEAVPVAAAGRLDHRRARATSTSARAGSTSRRSSPTCAGSRRRRSGWSPTS